MELIAVFYKVNCKISNVQQSLIYNSSAGLQKFFILCKRCSWNVFESPKDVRLILNSAHVLPMYR